MRARWVNRIERATLAGALKNTQKTGFSCTVLYGGGFERGALGLCTYVLGVVHARMCAYMHCHMLARVRVYLVKRRRYGARYNGSLCVCICVCCNANYVDVRVTNQMQLPVIRVRTRAPALVMRVLALCVCVDVPL